MLVVEDKCEEANMTARTTHQRQDMHVDLSPYGRL